MTDPPPSRVELGRQGAHCDKGKPDEYFRQNSGFHLFSALQKLMFLYYHLLYPTPHGLVPD